MEGMGQTTGQQQTAVDPSLEATRKRFNDAFNRFDAKEVASYWAEDGTLIDPLGEFGRGRSGVERVYGKNVETVLEGTTSTFTILSVRQVGSDCALLDLDHDVRDFNMPDGSKGPMKLHVVLLAQKKGNAWQWLDVRPYAFMQPPQRLQ